VRYILPYFIFILSKVNRFDHALSWQGCGETGTPRHSAHFLEVNWHSWIKKKICMLFGTSFSFPVINLTSLLAHMGWKICTKMSITALLLLVKEWRQSKCLTKVDSKTNCATRAQWIFCVLSWSYPQIYCCHLCTKNSFICVHKEICVHDCILIENLWKSKNCLSKSSEESWETEGRN
jgi:hypothetical protein